MSTASALARKTWWHTRNLRLVLREQSRFKIGVIACFAIGFEIGLYVLFLDGFRFLHTLGGAGRLILNHLFALFFLGMGLMLAISSAVTAYGTFFRSEEIPFLMVRPFGPSEVVLYKFVQTAYFAAWSFLFVIIPFVAAFARHVELSPLFIVWTAAFSLPFLFLCAALGTLAVLPLARWLPRGRWLRYAGAVLAVAAVVLAWHAWQAVRPAPDEASFNLARLLPGLKPATHKLMPSWWVADGILALAQRHWGYGFTLLALLTTTALAAVTLVEWLGCATFADAWQGLAEGKRRTKRPPVLLPRLERALGFLAVDVRALVLKDVRTFLRDPGQWSQTVIFFGLLAFYFANLRSFRYHMLPEAWRNAIAFLNVFSVAAVICSLGSRFVYPQLSLEGQAFWIVGLSPVNLRRVLLAKFGLAAVTLLAISSGLMTFSAAMLSASAGVRVLAAALAACIAVAVCGLSSGLGAVFLDLRSQNPSAIVSSFGGTLNLVLSLFFMLAAILPFGFVFHLRTVGLLAPAGFTHGMVLASLWLAVLTAAATAIPLWLGARSLAQREF